MTNPLIVLQKPKFGEPCNRCGECCRHELCEVAMFVFRPHEDDYVGPCPALELEGVGPETRCGMLTRPELYLKINWPVTERGFVAKYLSPDIAAYLGIGKGCGAPDEELQ